MVSASVFGGPRDSLRNKYALEDPRNPNCPCRTYQKKAEKEFFENRKEEQKIIIQDKLDLKKVKSGNRGVRKLRRTKSFFKAGKNQQHITKRQKRKRSLKFLFKKDIAACP